MPYTLPEYRIARHRPEGAPGRAWEEYQRTGQWPKGPAGRAWPYGYNVERPWAHPAMAERRALPPPSSLTGEFINNNFVLPTSTLPGGRAGLAGYFVNGSWVTAPFETPGLGAFDPRGFVSQYKWPLLALLGGLFFLGGKRGRRR